jgi:DNA-binding response OmpR family regulator
VAREEIPALNWLINQCMVVAGPQGYQLFSPLLADFLANRLANVTSALPAKRAVPPPLDEGIYEQLSKTERGLLYYFQTHPNTIIAPEQLLADVWKRPDASPRRVQEAIRRLRLQLEVADPPIGNVENERGRGYRFIPAP